jgi:hypothetical protein
MAIPKWVKEQKERASQQHRTTSRPWFVVENGAAIMGILKRREDFTHNNRPRSAYVVELTQPCICQTGKKADKPVIEEVLPPEHINVGVTASMRCVEDMDLGCEILIIVTGEKMTLPDGKTMWPMEISSVPIPR